MQKNKITEKEICVAFLLFPDGNVCKVTKLLVFFLNVACCVFVMLLGSGRAAFEMFAYSNSITGYQ